MRPVRSHPWLDVTVAVLEIVFRALWWTVKLSFRVVFYTAVALLGFTIALGMRR